MPGIRGLQLQHLHLGEDSRVQPTQEQHSKISFSLFLGFSSQTAETLMAPSSHIGPCRYPLGTFGDKDQSSQAALGLVVVTGKPRASDPPSQQFSPKCGLPLLSLPGLLLGNPTCCCSTRLESRQSGAPPSPLQLEQSGHTLRPFTSDHFLLEEPTQTV